MFSINGSIDFKSAAVLGGIAVAWGTLNPSSVWGGLAAVVSGVFGSLSLYIPLQMASERHDKLSHRAVKPMIIESKTEQFESALNKAFDRIQKHSHYEFFNRVIQECKAPQFFKKMISLGYCQGITATLLKAMEKNPAYSASQLLSSVEFEEIVYDQMLHTMLASIQAAERRVQNKIQSSKSMDNTYKKMLGAVSQGQDQPNPEIQKLEAGADHLKMIISSIEKDCFPWKEASCPEFPAATDVRTWNVNLETLMRAQGLSPGSLVYGRIEIHGDKEDRKQLNYRSGHVVLFRCSSNQCGFYDTISHYDGGFFEYTNKAVFLQALKKQLHEDLYNCKNPQVTFFIKATNNYGAVEAKSALANSGVEAILTA